MYNTDRSSPIQVGLLRLRINTVWAKCNHKVNKISLSSLLLNLYTMHKSKKGVKKWIKLMIIVIVKRTTRKK